MTDKAVAPADYIGRFGGVQVTAVGTKLAGEKAGTDVDVIGAWNAVNDPDVNPDAGWTPVLYGLPVAAELAIRSATPSSRGPARSPGSDGAAGPARARHRVEPDANGILLIPPRRTIIDPPAREEDR